MLLLSIYFILKNFIFKTENMNDKDKNLEIKFQFIEDEIEIRVESIKQDAEQAGQQLKDKLNDVKKEVLT